MYTPQSPYTSLALEVITHTVKNIDLKTIRSKTVPEEMKEQAACFVSIHKNDGSLRGCIGTIYPREKNLYLEIIGNAVSAATKDSRFDPIEPLELEQLEVSVDVLSKPELIKNIDELDPEKFGIIVSDGKFSRGVLLPHLEGVTTVEKQLFIAKRKAGLGKVANESLEIYKFSSTRYY